MLQERLKIAQNKWWTQGFLHFTVMVSCIFLSKGQQGPPCVQDPALHLEDSSSVPYNQIQATPFDLILFYTCTSTFSEREKNISPMLLHRSYTA